MVFTDMQQIINTFPQQRINIQQQRTLFSMQSMLRLYNKNQLDKPISRQKSKSAVRVSSCIDRCHYQVMNSEDSVCSSDL
jgi:hypothetical protein